MPFDLPISHNYHLCYSKSVARRSYPVTRATEVEDNISPSSSIKMTPNCVSQYSTQIPNSLKYLKSDKSASLPKQFSPHGAERKRSAYLPVFHLRCHRWISVNLVKNRFSWKSEACDALLADGADWNPRSTLLLI